MRLSQLPDHRPATEIVPLPDDWDITYSQSAMYPPIRKLSDGRLVVDMWSGAEGSQWGKAWARADHPNLSALPEHAPRAVKALYRADGQLAVLRGDQARVEAAMDAWGKFNEP